MKTINIKDIRYLNPCYDPIKHLPEDWSGTIQELLCYEHIPAIDRLWVAVKSQFLSERVLKEYAVACARVVEHLANDERVVNCNNATERFLDGKDTEQERIAVYDNAYLAVSYTVTSIGLTASASASAYAARSATTAPRTASNAYIASAATATAYACLAAFGPTAGTVTYTASKEEMEEQQCQLLLYVIEMVGEAK